VTPAEFLALYQREPPPPPPPKPNPRAYLAYGEGSNETFLTMHTAADGLSRSLPYNQVHLVMCDERGGTVIRLHGPVMFVEFKGRNLGPLLDRLRLRACAHVYEFNGGKHDPPEPSDPIVMQIVFQSRPAPPPRPAQPPEQPKAEPSPQSG
jgi:hypothetical protein